MNNKTRSNSIKIEHKKKYYQGKLSSLNYS